MKRPKRIRRTLSLRVSEAPPKNPNETWTPGARFLAGWNAYQGVDVFPRKFATDAVYVAGWVAAKAAWMAHFDALNHIAPAID